MIVMLWLATNWFAWNWFQTSETVFLGAAFLPFAAATHLARITRLKNVREPTFLETVVQKAERKE